MNFESRILFQSSQLHIGRFRCNAASDLWQTENYTGQYPIVVFPRIPVAIHQAARPSVVATPIHVMLYNSCHPYRRELIDPRGDISDFFALQPGLIREISESAGGHVDDDCRAPFASSHSACPSRTYLIQRALFGLVESGKQVDPVFIDETFMNLLPDLLQSSWVFSRRGKDATSAVQRGQRDQVEASKAFISQQFRQPLKMEDIARVADCSVYHLCRIFKKFTGLTVHRFLTHCRLRCSMEEVMDSNRPLTRVALDLGFCSHSHFTNAFRAEFGVPPRRMRDMPHLALLQNDLPDAPKKF